jgi:hypothetical protein
MATTDNMAGLFATPEQYQQAQLAQQQALAAQMAQLTPEQQANAGLRVAGYQLGSGIAGALGAQDPMLKLQTIRNQIIRNVDQTNPQSMMQAAQQLAQAGDAQGASQLAQLARTANEQLAKTSSESVVGKALVSGKYTPESLAKFQTSGNVADLEAIDLSAKPSEDWLAVAREMGLKAGKSFNDYTPTQVAEVNKQVFSKDIQKKAAGAAAIRLDIGSAIEKAFLVKDREKAAEAWAQAGDAYKASTNTLASLDTFEQTAKAGFTGAGADAKLALSKAMSAMGVPISARASDTEISNALSSTLVQQIAKVFPGSQSNKELSELLKSKPNISQELPTILRLINKMRIELKAKNLTYEQGAALSDQERSSFNPNLAEGKNFAKLTRYDTLTKKYQSGNITPAERAEAKKIQEELKLD